MYLKSINLHIESWLFEEDDDNNDKLFTSSITCSVMLVLSFVINRLLVYTKLG